MSADLERDEGLGTRDGKRWEGEAPAEPKRQRLANSEWRIANSEQQIATGETAANGEQ
jgi:hypothetical protein